MAELCNKKIISLGKPSTQLGALLKEKYNLTTPNRCLLVGDCLTLDVSFGLACGFQTLFIMSRDNAKKDLAGLPPAAKPHYVADALADFIEFFKPL